MEGNKNAMYVEAGRIRGWQVVSEEAPMKTPAVPERSPVIPPIIVPPAVVNPMLAPKMPAPKMPASPMMPAPKMPVPMMPAPKMPTPIMPTPVVALNAESHKGCQEYAMAYVAMEEWQEIYEPEKGFECGTLFAELDLPFAGEGACRHG